MNNSLENALLLIGYGLSVNARAHYLKLLPDDLADSVDERIRATTTVDVAGLDTGQRRLLGMLRHELVEEDEEDDPGETPVAEEQEADDIKEVARRRSKVKMAMRRQQQPVNFFQKGLKPI